MRALIFLAYLLATTFAAHAQEETTTERKRIFEWHLSGGIVANQDFNINKNLSSADVKEISTLIPMATIGWTVNFKRYSVDAEFGMGGFWKRNDGYRFNQFPLTVRGNYLILDGKDVSFTAGIGFSYISNDLSVYSDETVIDMNDLDPDNNSGYIRLRNNNWFVGPSMSFTLGKWSEKNTRLTLGYDIAVSDSEWKADYGKVANPVKEKANRFFVRLTMPL